MEKKSKSDWTLDPEKYLSKKRAARLVATAKSLADQAILKGGKIPYRNHFVICLALSTGLRVMEISRLKCGDLFLDEEPSCVLVRRGKGNKRRLVQISRQFRKQCEEYLNWKGTLGEPICPDAPLILSSNTKRHLTTRALQNAFKKVALLSKLPSHYSIHCLRHTYACLLYKASNYNLRLVQKQLGHANAKTTQVYADVMAPDMTKAVEKLWN